MNDQTVLRYAGLMGHTVALVIDDGEGGRRVTAQCDDVAWATKLSLEYADRNPTVYKKTDKGWKAVKAV